MTDERAKEIADDWRAQIAAAPSDARYAVLPDTVDFLLHLYDDVQAIKSAMTGLAHFGIGGSIKRGGE